MGPLLIQLGPAAPCAGEESRFFAADGGHGPTSYGWTAIAVLHLHIDIISTSNNVSNSTDLLWHWNSVNPFPILNFCQPRAQRMQSAWQKVLTFERNSCSSIPFLWGLPHLLMPSVLPQQVPVPRPSDGLKWWCTPVNMIIWRVQ